MGKELNIDRETYNNILEMELCELMRSKEMENEIKICKREIRRTKIIKWSLLSFSFLVLGAQILFGWIDWQNENGKENSGFDSHSTTGKIFEQHKNETDSLLTSEKDSCSKNFRSEKNLNPPRRGNRYTYDPDPTR